MTKVHTVELFVNQAVKYRNVRGKLAALTDDGGARFESDEGAAYKVRLCELQPISIKKSFGVEGNNFID